MYIIKEIQLLSCINGVFLGENIPLLSTDGVITINSKLGITLEKYNSIHLNISSQIICDWKSCHFTPIDSEHKRLLFVNRYTVENLKFNWVELNFYCDNIKEDKIDGYIIFIKSMPSSIIQTDGEYLFKKSNSEAICVLREGNSLTAMNKKLEVINNKLVLNI